MTREEEIQIILDECRLTREELVMAVMRGYKVTVDEKGTIVWEKDGKIHRDGGPAIIWDHGGLTWYCRGEMHRTDGPAVVMANGLEAWFKHGKKHREDGPAIYGPKRTGDWYLDDVLVTREEVMGE